MSQEMKLIMENWRQATIEEDWATLQETLDEASFLEKVKSLFKTTDPLPEMGHFNPVQPYPAGSYGSFALTHQVLAKLKEKNVKANKETIAAGVTGTIGAGGGKAGAAVAVALGVAGLFAVAPVALGLGIAGVTAAAIGLISEFRKKPQEEGVHPYLKFFQLDEEYVKLLDNDLEDELLAKYQEHFTNNLKTQPEATMKSINKFVEEKLFTNPETAGHTVTTRSPQPQS